MAKEDRHDPQDSIDWTDVEEALARQDSGLSLTRQPTAELSFPTRVEAFTGILARLRAHTITKQAGLQALRKLHAQQLEVLEFQLREATRTKKAEVHLLAEQFLANIQAQYNQFLAEIGVKNEAARYRALVNLNDTVAEILSSSKGKDWPPRMFERTVKLITDRYERFADKLMSDIDETP